MSVWQWLSLTLPVYNDIRTIFCLCRCGNDCHWHCQLTPTSRQCYVCVGVAQIVTDTASLQRHHDNILSLSVWQWLSLTLPDNTDIMTMFGLSRCGTDCHWHCQFTTTSGQCSVCVGVALIVTDTASLQRHQDNILSVSAWQWLSLTLTQRLHAIESRSEHISHFLFS